MEKIYVTRPSIPEFEEYVEEIRSLWDTKWLTNMGPKHKEFQEKLQEYLGVPQIELFTNGHMALELCLQAIGLEGEVITTPFSFASTTHAIVRNNLKPVFCDINQNDYTLDADKIESLITDKTCAILPVHVYGNACDIEKIEEIADKHGLKVIYDAAHAFGETYKGRGIGNFGNATMFSFHSTKVFNSIEGGAICHNSVGLGEALYDLKNFGIHDTEHVMAVGANAKLNELCAAMGICNLRHISKEIEKRKVISDLYDKRLSFIEGITLNAKQEYVSKNYAYYPILVDPEKFICDRDRLYEILMDNNVYARKYFYPLINEYDCYKEKYGMNDTPIAKKISEQVLTLPIYADMSISEAEYIISIIEELR